MNQRTALGKRGEDMACRFLGTLGWEVIERNWRCARGEIDIVARDGGTIVVVEVKTRSSLGAGHPFEAITPQKLARLKLLAGEWCRERRPGSPLVRVDAVAVLMPRNQPAVVDHLRDITR